MLPKQQRLRIVYSVKRLSRRLYAYVLLYKIHAIVHYGQQEKYRLGYALYGKGFIPVSGTVIAVLRSHADADLFPVGLSQLGNIGGYASFQRIPPAVF